MHIGYLKLRSLNRWKSLKWTSYSRLSSRKKPIYIVTYVDRATRYIMNWAVTFERSDEVFQDLLDETQPARWYYSDAALVYEDLLYPGIHFMMSNKSQTFSVEGVNAELRHYLARLVRRSRCFSRSQHALRWAIRLFVYCHNMRQLYCKRFPDYLSNIRDFLPALC